VESEAVSTQKGIGSYRIFLPPQNMQEKLETILSKPRNLAWLQSGYKKRGSYQVDLPRLFGFILHLCHAYKKEIP
jgi:hypothetical protein